MPYLKLMMIILMLFNAVVAVAQERELTLEEQAKLAQAQQYNLIAVEFYQKGQAQQAVPYLEEAFRIRKTILSEKHPATLSSLGSLALIYQYIGNLDEALRLFEKIYASRKQVLGKKHPDTLLSMRHLGMIYHDIGLFKKALPFFEKAYALRKKVLGKKHLDTLQSLSDLAMIYQSTGQFAKALPLYEQAYMLTKQVLDDETHPDIRRNLNNLASIYQDIGRLSEALSLYEKAYMLSVQVLGKRHHNTLIIINNLVSLYFDLGHFTVALPLSEEAYELTKQVLGEKHMDTLISLNSLAEIYRAIGRLTEALPLSKKAYALRKQVLGDKHPDTLQSLNNLALIYLAVGYITKALSLSEKAYALRKQVLDEKHPDTLQSLNNLAGVYMTIGHLEDALSLFQKSYELRKQVLGEMHSDALQSLQNLAAIYQVVGKLDEALLLSRKAYTFFNKVLGEKHPSTLTSLNNLAEIYRDIGNLPEALSLSEKSYTLRKQVLGEMHPDTLTSLNNLAGFYNETGRLDKSMSLFEKAYTQSKQVLGEKHSNTLRSLNNLAMVYAKLGRINKGITHLEQLVEDIESLRQAHLSAENRRAMFAQNTDSYFYLSGLYFLQNNYQAAFHTAEKTKARTLLESIAFKLALQQVDFTAEERQKLNQQQATLVYLDKKIAETDNLEQRTLLRVEKNNLLEQINSFHHTLKQKYPKFAELLEPEIITAEKGQALLPLDTLFISYLQHSRTHQLLVFTLDATGKLQAQDLGKIAGLEQTLTIYRQVLGTTIMGLRKQGQSVWQLADGSFVMGDKPSRDKKPRRVKHVDEISRYLAAQLLQPIAEQLKTKSHWIISPSGALAQIPFETLILDNDQPVIANYDISYAQSLSTFAMLKKRETAYQQVKGRKTLLAMGNPRYHDPKAPPKNCNVPTVAVDMDKLARGNHYQETLRSANKNWCNLPGTQQELEMLKNLYPDSTIYQQADASESHLQQLNQQQQLLRYENLVFATHGFLHPQTSALSALVLDQLNTTDEYDGYLTAVEWIGYQLKSDLMVLSACQTGLGETVSGEGIMGLPYALYIAGNKNTLMTLWKVDDAKTAEFMRRFFTKVNHGISHIRALTETKREFMQAHQNPIYWAAFVLYGV